MTQRDKDQLELEVQHIFDSGANEMRIMEMVERFVDNRYISKEFVGMIQVEEEIEVVFEILEKKFRVDLPSANYIKSVARNRFSDIYDHTVLVIDNTQVELSMKCHLM